MTYVMTLCSVSVPDDLCYDLCNVSVLDDLCNDLCSVDFSQTGVLIDQAAA